MPNTAGIPLTARPAFPHEGDWLIRNTKFVKWLFRGAGKKAIARRRANPVFMVDYFPLKAKR